MAIFYLNACGFSTTETVAVGKLLTDKGVLQRFPPTEEDMRTAEGDEAGPSVADVQADKGRSRKIKSARNHKPALFFTPEEVRSRSSGLKPSASFRTPKNPSASFQSLREL